MRLLRESQKNIEKKMTFGIQRIEKVHTFASF